jgi:hypothetical protein
VSVAVAAAVVAAVSSPVRAQQNSAFANSWQVLQQVLQQLLAAAYGSSKTTISKHYPLPALGMLQAVYHGLFISIVVTTRPHVTLTRSRCMSHLAAEHVAALNHDASCI